LEKKGWDAQLAISVSGLVVTVAAGSFKIRGHDYVLVEDATYTATPDADGAITALCLLAKDTGNGDAVVLVVDEMGEWDEAGFFDWSTSQYEIISQLLSIQVSAGAVSLAEEDLAVTHYVPPAED
jgi:hypothetical protein